MSEQRAEYVTDDMQELIDNGDWQSFDAEYRDDTPCPNCGTVVLIHDFYTVTIDGDFADSVTVIRCPNVRGCDYKRYEAE